MMNPIYYWALTGRWPDERLLTIFAIIVFVFGIVGGIISLVDWIRKR